MGVVGVIMLADPKDAGGRSTLQAERDASDLVAAEDLVRARADLFPAKAFELGEVWCGIDFDQELAAREAHGPRVACKRGTGGVAEGLEHSPGTELFTDAAGAQERLEGAVERCGTAQLRPRFGTRVRARARPPRCARTRPEDRAIRIVIRRVTGRVTWLRNRVPLRAARFRLRGLPTRAAARFRDAPARRAVVPFALHVTDQASTVIGITM
jgi:hypothetical protein